MLMLMEPCYLLMLGKKGDCTISIKESDFMDMVSGKVGPQKVIL